MERKQKEERMITSFSTVLTMHCAIVCQNVPQHTGIRPHTIDISCIDGLQLAARLAGAVARQSCFFGTSAGKSSVIRLKTRSAFCNRTIDHVVNVLHCPVV